MKTPVTHERLQNHLTYSWWKYVLMMVLVIFFWSILFTTTRYRPPEEKKVVVGVYGAGNQTALDAYMEDVRQLLLPDMEEMNTQFIMRRRASATFTCCRRTCSRRMPSKGYLWRWRKPCRT